MEYIRSIRQSGEQYVTVFDPDAEWTVDPAAFLSKGRNTPYAGEKLRGRAIFTIVDGVIVHTMSNSTR